jgi:hypothetical protein
MFLKTKSLFIRFDSIQGFKKVYRNNVEHICIVINGIEQSIIQFNSTSKCDKCLEFLCEKLVESTQHGTNYGIVDLDEFYKGLIGN